MDEPETSGIPWREMLAILGRRRSLIVTVLAGGLISSVILSFLQEPTYRASAKLMVTSKRARITVSPDPQEGARVDHVTEQDLNSETALLQSPSLIREVLEPYQNQIAQLPKGTGWGQAVAALLRYPLQLPGRIYRKIHGVGPPTPLDEWVDATAKHLAVTGLTGSNLILVSYESPRPKWAADFVNEMVKHHVERHVRLNQQAAALSFFESQRQLLSERVRSAETALTNFYQREGIIDGAPEQRDVLRTHLGELRSAAAKSDTDLAEGAARAEFLTKALNAHPKNLSSARRPSQNDPLQFLKRRILELKLQRSELLSKFAPTSVKVQEVDRQIEEARQLLATQQASAEDDVVMNPTNEKLDLDLTQTQAQIAALKARSEALRSQIANDEANLDHLDQVAAEQDRLEQELASAKESLRTYSRKQEEARFSDALDESGIVNVSVVESAEVPTAPQPSKRQMILLLGTAMSLFAGLGLAFVRDRIDPSVKSAAEAANLSGLTILADIPS